MRYTFTTLLSAVFFLSVTSAKAQVTDDTGKNLLKINVPAIALNNYSFQYERVVGKKITAGAGIRFMPKGKLPLKSILESVIDDDDTWNRIENMKTSNFAFTPEVRFYLGEHVLRGFYVAPFAKIARYTGDIPDFKYDVAVPASANPSGSITKTIPIDGRINTVTGGVLIGAQWKLSRLLYLDWWILGPQYGRSKGHLESKVDLSDENERKALADELEGLDIPLVDTDVSVTSTGARMDLKGPWTGVRAGINLGVRF